MNKWDERFLGLARHVAEWSKDPSTKVGSVITDSSHRVVSLGYNGPSRGLEDEGLDRDRKLMRTIHGEMNAILFANCDLSGTTLYVTHPPCASCAAVIVQVGIKRVVTHPMDMMFYERWRVSMEESEKMFKEAGVIVTCYNY